MLRYDDDDDDDGGDDNGNNVMEMMMMMMMMMIVVLGYGKLIDKLRSMDCINSHVLSAIMRYKHTCTCY